MYTEIRYGRVGRWILDCSTLGVNAKDNTTRDNVRVLSSRFNTDN